MEGETYSEKLEMLQRINGDAYAWLDIPGTDISFPILQDSQDTAFYLSHNEDRETTMARIYTEYVNGKEFTDNNTVIYGRNVSGVSESCINIRIGIFFDKTGSC